MNEPSVLPPVNLDLKAMLKQFQEMQERLDRMEFIRKNYIEIAGKMDGARQAIFKACKELEDLAQQIDPAIVLNKSARKPRVKQMRSDEMKDVIRSIHEKLIGGVHITTAHIKQMYPDMTTGQIFNLILRLREIDGVQSTKDGRNVRLFV